VPSHPGRDAGRRRRGVLTGWALGWRVVRLLPGVHGGNTAGGPILWPGAGGSAGPGRGVRRRRLPRPARLASGGGVPSRRPVYGRAADGAGDGGAAAHPPVPRRTAAEVRGAVWLLRQPGQLDGTGRSVTILP